MTDTTYRIHFIGRRVGALGIRYGSIVTITAANEAAAKLALYKDYEHINVLKIVEVPSYTGVGEVSNG